MTGPLVLIEPYADRLGGHHQRTLVALAQARPGSLVITPHGIVREAAAVLREAGARLVTAPAGHPAAVLLAASASRPGSPGLGYGSSARAAGRASCGGFRTRSPSSPGALRRRRPCGPPAGWSPAPRRW